MMLKNIIFAGLFCSVCFTTVTSSSSSSSVFLEHPSKEYFLVTNQPALLSCAAGPVLQLLIRCDNHWLPPSILNTEEISFEHVNEIINKNSKERALKDEIYDGEDKNKEQPNRNGPLHSAQGRFLKTTVNVTKTMLESSANPEEYYCECSAVYLPKGQPATNVKSNTAKISVAYIQRDFKQQPMDTRTELYSSTLLPCSPPSALPSPVIKWFKDSHEIIQDPSYIISSEGSLIIPQVGFEHQGSYQCVVKNVAGTTTSAEAQLIVYVNGEWGSWSEWGVCKCLRARGTKTRKRTCTHPQPRNGGTPCSGASKQKVSCVCEAVGQWSSWSEWSLCDVSCLRYKRRYCDQPESVYCGDKDLQTEVCVQCNPSDGSSSPAYKIIPLVLALFFVVIAALAVVFCCYKMKKRQKKFNGLKKISNLLLKPDITESLNESCNNNKILNNNGFNTDNINGYDDYSFINNYNNVSTNFVLINESNNNNSNKKANITTNSSSNKSVSPCDSMHSHTTDNTNLFSQSQHSYHISNNVYCNDSKNNIINENVLNNSTSANYAQPQTDNKNNYSDENKNCPLESGLYAKYSIDPLAVLLANKVSASINLQTLACLTIDEFGGLLTDHNSGISMWIPEGALNRGEVGEFFIGLSRGDEDKAKLRESQTLLSDVIVCGPTNIKLSKSCVIKFPHCIFNNTQKKINCNSKSQSNSENNNNSNNLMNNRAVLKNNKNFSNQNKTANNLKASLYHSALNYEQNPLYKACQLSQNKSLNLKLEENHCTLVTSFLGQYLLVGDRDDFSKPSVNTCYNNVTPNEMPGLVGKRLRLAVYAPLVSPSVEMIIRIYFVIDTLDAMKGVEEVEKELGGLLLGETQIMNFHADQSHMCVSVDDLDEMWMCVLPDQCMEIPFSHIWNNTQSLMHCSFTLQAINPTIHSSIHPSVNPSYTDLHPSTRAASPISFSLRIFQRSRPNEANVFFIKHNTTEI